MTTTLTRAQVQAARERAEKATPGPWATDRECMEQAVLRPNGVMVCDCCIMSFSPPVSDKECSRNGRFIAASRTDVPALCDLAEALADIVHRWNRYRLGENFNGLDADKLIADTTAFLATYDGARP